MTAQPILTIDDLLNRRIEFQIGSMTTWGTFSKDELLELIRRSIKHELFNGDFYYNWTDKREEYASIFKKTLDDIMSDTNAALKEYFIMKNGKVTFNNDCAFTIDNWFKTNKEISSELKNDYYYYRKKYSGVTL